MIDIKDKRECCGCTACASICPHNAIAMKPDVFGFKYPVVDIKKCVDCGVCNKVCAFNDNYALSLNFDTPIAYAARHKDINEIMAARSGATFVAISDYILSLGGVIYGVGYTDHFRVAHKRATTKTERDEFRGSKYVQSDLGDIFSKVKDDLKKDYLVLFVGTPCQTSGLNSYIGKKLRKNLLLIDIVCHGVTGPRLWEEYIDYIEKKEGSKITWVNFRDKDQFGWDAHVETFKIENKPKEKIHYAHGFYKSIMFRPSCNNCHFCNIRRPSDITLGDFWGWQNVCPEMNRDNKGLNLILLNTEKGVSIFDEIKEQLVLRKLEEGSYLQPNLMYPTVEHKKRDTFEKDYREKGVGYVVNHNYDPEPIQIRLKRVLRKLIDKI